MSGDVQPRKRKDKRKRKDELGFDEHRGTSAALGEGDVFIHSHHEHGTGGHWCAKIIFFSLLAVLITLVGLIILENRGLSELEANTVESRYSGVLEGWLEDAPEDDHHDKHTLELKQNSISTEDVKEYEDNQNVDENEDTEPEESDIDKEDNLSKEDDDHDLESDENEDTIRRNKYSSDQNDDDDNDEGDDENSDAENEIYENDDDDEENYQDEDDDGDDNNFRVKIENYNSKQDEGNNNDDKVGNSAQSFEEQSDDDGGGGGEDDDNDDEDDDDRDGYENDAEDDNKSIEEEEEEKEESDYNSIKSDDRKVDKQDFDSDVYYSYGEQVINRQNIDDSNENDNDEDENHHLVGNSAEQNENDDDHENDVEKEDTNIERIEREVLDDGPISAELPTARVDDVNDSQQASQEIQDEEDDDDENDEDEFLEDFEDDELPVVEHITAPAGKPFDEVEEESSTEQSPGPDSLADEEEYEKRQEELRREDAEASHMWLKLFVGGALLVATHALIRRASGAHEVPTHHTTREETPGRDRRMTLILEESPSVNPENVFEHKFSETAKEIIRNTPTITKLSHTTKHSEDDDEKENNTEEEQLIKLETTAEDKELYSDDEDEDVNEQENLDDEIEDNVREADDVEKEAVVEEEIEDDVEIIEDEQIEEEEEISDVDDTELLSRLEAKYGRLPEPERFGPKPKDGGNSIEEEWPGEPTDAYWRDELNKAEEELRQGSWESCSRRAAGAGLRDSARARLVAARALDALADARKDNRLLSQAIQAYLHLLKMSDKLTDQQILNVTARTLDRIQFRGSYLSAEPVYRLLIRRFPDDPKYRNQLSITFLMANRPELAEEVLKETLKRWPDDRVALAHHGFVLKTHRKRQEEAVVAFQKALEGDAGPANEARFYFHLGDSLLILGRYEEAHEVHKRGAALGHFLSPYQRSLYNVDRLKSQPWWDASKTYLKLARALESSWKEILREGLAAQALYEKEKEGLKERGEWSQLDLFVRGAEVERRCSRAPTTCAVVRSEPAARCTRGQVKFSAMAAGTHVRPHVGPTNCRLRMHLGLKNTKDTYIRVDKEIRQWQEGKVLMFDDSFEHEVWHNGSGSRLVLIVDVWHPDLTPAERSRLPAI